MKLDARPIVLAALLFAPAVSIADPLAQRGLEEAAAKGPDVTDNFIEERKRALDRVLAKRSEEAAREATEAIALENKLKQERLDFEKRQVSERRAFLDGLKKETDMKKRNSAYAKFNTEQTNERRKFFNGQNSRRGEMVAATRKSRMMRHDQVSAPGSAPARPASNPPAGKPSPKKK